MGRKNRNLLQRLMDGLELLSSGVKAHLGDPDAWESAIKKFEAQDSHDRPLENSIVFIGSSSFNFWTTMEKDMAPLPVINRGFGGARMRDVIRYVDRIVTRYRPRAVVLFAGANDIPENKPDTAREIFAGYRNFVERVHAELPETIIYFVAITPVPARWRYWPIAAEANRLVERYAQTHPNLRYIDFTDELLGEDGTPDRSLYKIDQIHPNRNGYVKWMEAIKGRLLADLSFD